MDLHEAKTDANAQPVDEEAKAARKRAYLKGIVVFIALAALTLLEFLIATVAGGSTVFLFIIALAKAGLVIQYYMHLNSVWDGEEAH